MRKLTKNQAESSETLLLGVILIEEINFDHQDRDEITKTLMALQAIFKNKPLRNAILALLASSLNKSKDKGREGMDFWTIFVLGSLRLVCGWDYDKLYNQYSHHLQIRQITGIDSFLDRDKKYSRSAINENMKFFSEDVIRKINKLIVDFGHTSLGETDTLLKSRCDSFVLKTNIHFPTDCILLLDCCRVLFRNCEKAAQDKNLAGWREHKSAYKKLKALSHKISKMKCSTSKDKQKKLKRKEEIEEQVRQYLNLTGKLISKVLTDWDKFSLLTQFRIESALFFAQKIHSQIQRRVLHNETIASSEKIYSIFEPHSEWICKGKAGVRQELGVRFAVLEDQFGFILNSQVMHKQQDVDIAVDIVEQTKKLFGNLDSVSFDKGFHSATQTNGMNNRLQIEQLGITCCLPKKGKRNKQETERESTSQFIAQRKQHSAIESAIHALQNHGLDKCRDKGQEHFDRYALLGVLAHNIHNLGKILLKKAKTKEEKAA